ncbi:MAG: NADH-quinone oxidoreductase subunit J [Candidatus Kapabacteria bacterium]|nr:NADH-quinone oxidoreductase subunit J [Ignavibacteriota bacterium]MCW5885592.1 NADH-quinone oxidoreductase subunit J [Candidatus Kapabacteria bacterium]
MNWYDIVFYGFAAIVLISAAGVVFSRKMMYSAFSLLFTFFGVAGLYVLLNADFIAVTQIMVYIGGILILIIFGVMLTSKFVDLDIKSGTTGTVQYVLAGLATVTFGGFLIYMYLSTSWFEKPVPVVESTVKPIGILLMTEYFLAFQVAAILLLIAFIGAAKIARRK